MNREHRRVTSGGRLEHGPRSRARAATVVVPHSRRVADERLDLARLVPSGRSLALAVLIVVGAVAVWFGARETGVFAVRAIEVGGASPRVATQVRKALAPTRGTSLLKVDLGAAERAVESLPTVASARFDRAYPHSLRVVIVPERPVAVARQGADSYLLARSGRVIAAVDRRDRPRLARIWVKRDVELRPGAFTRGRASDRGGGRLPARRLAVSRAGQLGHDDARGPDAPAPLRARDPSRRPGRRAVEARRGRARDPSARGRYAPISTSRCPNGRSREPSTLR